MGKHLQLTDRLDRYLLDFAFRDDDLLRALRDETAMMPNAQMQIAPEQGQFMALLARIAGVRKALEIGTFTG